MAQSSKIRPAFGWILLTVLVSACLALFVNVQLGLFTLVFAAMGWWVWENSEEGFLMFLILAPLLSMLKVTQTIGTVTLIKDTIIFLLFLRVVAWPALTKRLPYRRSLLFGPVLALGVWTVWEALRADSLTLGILRARDIILYLLLYFTALYLPANKEIWMKRLWWFALGFLIAVGHAAYQWFFAADSAVLRFDPGRQVWILRISSTFGHPSVYGEYLVAVSALFLSCVLFLRRMQDRILFSVLFLLSLPFIFLTYSRAVWIGFAVAVGVMGIVWLLTLPRTRVLSAASPPPGARRSTFRAAGGGPPLPPPARKLWLLFVSALLVLIVLFVFVLRFTPAGPLLRSAFDPTYKSNQERLEFAARLVAPMSNVEAIIGRGLGDVVQQQLRSVEVGAEEIAAGASREVQLAKDATLVDNQYLKTFVEMGLIGLAIYFWLFWRFARGGWALVRQHGGRHKQIIGFWSAAFLAAFVVQGLFIDIWDIFSTNAVFWIVGGLVSAALTEYTEI